MRCFHFAVLALLLGQITGLSPVAAQEELVNPAAPAAPAPPAQPALDDVDRLLDMDLDQLSQVTVYGAAPASLTDYQDQTTAELPSGYVIPPVDRRTPAAVTRIDYDQIRSSGARSLNELFDVYVPNTQVIRHHYSLPHVAPRGLVSDAEDKYLLLVNGKVMNQHTFEGATSERDLPTLTDIHHIDFIRGPGSAVYGPGAISGVINIITHNGLTFQGIDANVRQGAFEEFSSLEVRYGEKLDEETGLFCYYGITDYNGAGIDDSAYVFGSSFATPVGTPDSIAGEPIDLDEIPRDHAAYRDVVKNKLHLQLDRGNFTAWVRYTNGGEKAAPEKKNIAITADGGFSDPAFPLDFSRPTQFGYQQVTAFSRYFAEWSETLGTEFRLSYDMFDFERGQDLTALWSHHREDEYYGRALTTWSPNEIHSFAVGVDLSREIFGLRSPGFPHQPLPSTSYITGPQTSWYTTMTSVLAEYRWQPMDEWTFFIGTREDVHTYTDWLTSPRAVAIYTPDEINTYKFIASQAVRKLPDGLIRQQFLDNGEMSDTEQIQSLEGRWERQNTEHFWTAMSGFYQDSEFVGYLFGTNRQERFATVATWGIELEGAYVTPRTRLSASHGFTTLDSFDLVDPNIVQGFSSMPYGFGTELANWSPHISKLQLQYKHTERLRSFNSMVFYWDFPGSEDYAAYNRSTATSTPGNSESFPQSDPGYREAFRGNYYVTSGMQYQVTSYSALSLHAFNWLGWFDEENNKRNYILGEQNANYRAEAPSIGVAFHMWR